MSIKSLIFNHSLIESHSLRGAKMINRPPYRNDDSDIYQKNSHKRERQQSFTQEHASQERDNSAYIARFTKFNHQFTRLLLSQKRQVIHYYATLTDTKGMEDLLSRDLYAATQWVCHLAAKLGHDRLPDRL